MSQYKDHVGSRVTVMTTYGMIYSNVELAAADDDGVMVRVDTKVDSKHYTIPAGRVRRVTVLGPAVTCR